jgi:hypothetical protein
MSDLQALLDDDDMDSFGRMSLQTGFLSAMVGGPDARCGRGIYSDTTADIVLAVMASCLPASPGETQ